MQCYPATAKHASFQKSLPIGVKRKSTEAPEKTGAASSQKVGAARTAGQREWWEQREQRGQQGRRSSGSSWGSRDGGSCRAVVPSPGPRAASRRTKWKEVGLLLLQSGTGLSVFVTLSVRVNVLTYYLLKITAKNSLPIQNKMNPDDDCKRANRRCGKC